MSFTKKINLLIVDDHKMVREGIKLILMNQNDYEIKIEVSENGEGAINKYKKTYFDIILMDINMIGMDGIQTTKEIVSINSSVKIIALSMHDEVYRINRMIEAGALGYLLKNAGSEELLKAIETVISGQQYFSNEVSLKLMGKYNQQVIEKHNVKKGVTKKISKREGEILNLIANEMTNEEIAQKLNLSKRTVDTHRQSMLIKLGLKNTAGLVKYAVINNLID